MTALTDLPEGWTEAKLADFAGAGGLFNDGDWIETKDQNPNGDIRLTQLADIGDGVFKDKSQRFLTVEKAEELGCTYLSPGDLLIARLPQPLGRTCIFPGDTKRCITAVDVSILRTGDPGVDNRWLMHFINSPMVRVQIEALQKGTTRPRIARRNLGSMLIPLPPLAEQKRIVVKVEELLARVNAAQDRLEKVPRIMKRFRQAVLSAACSGKLTEDWREQHPDVGSASGLISQIQNDRREDRRNVEQADLGEARRKYTKPQMLDTDDLPEIPDGWCWATLDQIRQEFRPIIYGIIKPGPHVADGVPYVRINEMRYGKIADISELRRADPQRAARFRRATLTEGDLLISKDGTIGIVAVVPPELTGGNITQHIVRAAIHRLMNRDYVVAAIRSPFCQHWLTVEQKGVALQGVNVEDFRQLPIPIPPIEEQHEIVRLVEPLFKLADAIEKRVELAKIRADKLTQSILAKAFRGELVPTETELARQEGRDYEPASVLLERIRQQRERDKGKQGKKR